jgi:hypothetical protein
MTATCPQTARTRSRADASGSDRRVRCQVEPLRRDGGGLVPFGARAAGRDATSACCNHRRGTRIGGVCVGIQAASESDDLGTPTASARALNWQRARPLSQLVRARMSWPMATSLANLVRAALQESIGKVDEALQKESYISRWS